MVPGSAMPHPPMPPARLARGSPVRVAQGLHGARLPHRPRPRPLRWRWQGRLWVVTGRRLWRATRRLHLHGLLQGQRRKREQKQHEGGRGVLCQSHLPPLIPRSTGGVGRSRAVAAPVSPSPRGISRKTHRTWASARPWPPPLGVALAPGGGGFQLPSQPHQSRATEALRPHQA